MRELQVVRTASAGIVIGKVFRVVKPSLAAEPYPVADGETEREVSKYEAAMATAVKQLEALQETNDIFGAHLEIVKDATLSEGIVSKITQERCNVQQALQEVAEEFIQLFEMMEDEYMKERAADIKDVRNRLMCALKGIQLNPFANICEQVIVVTDDLTPSDTAALDLSHVLGFITRDGGITSHVSIMAKNMGIPALVGVSEILNSVKADDLVIMDAGQGRILINPEEAIVCEYRRKQDADEKEQQKLSETSRLPVITKDGRAIAVCANVGNVEEVRAAKLQNVDGVGLFRSEFLYMENVHFPTEEEQFLVYKAAAELVQTELTIRTLDIGGDKELSYYTFEKEENPFLGWRAIRISLDMREMFKEQLKAILRASAFGPVRIMFPMIICLNELRMAKAILAECKEELRAAGSSFDEEIPVGIMIETPASVLCAEDFAGEVDFFSIGTNDLTQYILAVDRGNKKIAAAYNSFHPAILRSIRQVICAAHKNGIPVGMCGEFASDERAVKLLLGLGLDEFSMSAGSTAKVKQRIRDSSYEEARQYAGKICALKTVTEVEEALE